MQPVISPALRLLRLRWSRCRKVLSASLDLIGHVRVLFEVLFGIFAALADAFTFIGEP